MIFGNWRPGGTLAGATLFGYSDGLRLSSGPETVHALLYSAVIVAGLLVVWQLFRRRWTAAGLAAVGAVAVYVAVLRHRRAADASSCRTRRTSSRWSCWRSPRSDYDHPPRTACRTGGVKVTSLATVTTVDWDKLRAAAVEAAALAYCPYSGLQVGAARSSTTAGSWSAATSRTPRTGSALCAECTMAGQLRLTGGGRFVAVACRSGAGELLMPCGRCRQVLYELGGPDCLLDTPSRPDGDVRTCCRTRSARTTCRDRVLGRRRHPRQAGRRRALGRADRLGGRRVHPRARSRTSRCRRSRWRSSCAA